jgi:prepilin-type N-terminal cleavage/methylation domain-containing protein
MLSMLKRIKGFTLIELLIVVAIIAILAAIAIPNFLEAQTRSKVSRAQEDMRSVGIAVEAFYVDNFTYPMQDSSIPQANTGTPRADGSYPGQGVNDDPGLVQFAPSNMSYWPTFTHKTSLVDVNHVLTTPIGYIANFPQDAFKLSKGVRETFSYSRGGQLYDHWIIWSLGPDLNPDITWYYPTSGSAPFVDSQYYPSTSVPSQRLIAVTYDPTNGTESSGDVYRFKQ